MRALLAACILILAGCIQPTPTARSDDLTIHVVTDGPWSVALPLPSDDWIDGRWPDLLRVSRGSATVSVQGGPHPLVLSGNGTATIEAIGDWRDPTCCLLDFNDALWTSGDADQGLSFEVMEGRIASVSMSYSALACRGPGCDEAGADLETCTLEVRAVAGNVTVGPAAFPRQPVSRTCLP